MPQSHNLVTSGKVIEVTLINCSHRDVQVLDLLTVWTTLIFGPISCADMEATRLVHKHPFTNDKLTLTIRFTTILVALRMPAGASYPCLPSKASRKFWGSFPSYLCQSKAIACTHNYSP